MQLETVLALIFYGIGILLIMFAPRALKDKLFRLKTVGTDFLETQLKRCLSTFDITLLGVGHMIGAGVYVLTGAVVRKDSGPAVVLSFIFAGVASLLSALCYAEFGSRVPKAGSAYTYTYVTVGEFWAFIIGWNIILEHMLGAAAVARSWSGYLDSMLGHVIMNTTKTTVGTAMENDSHLLGDYPDFIAFLLVVVVSIFMGIGAKTSTNFNTVFTVINMAVITFVISYGLSFADFHNWSDSSIGGFMPKGFSGVLAGAASCFFAYVGFDGIATAGEEASDPGKSIPVATFVSMTIVTISYVLMSSALTLMIPWTHVHPTSAFADAFETRGALWAKYVVAVGALSGMTTSLVGSLFALPRCVYAMASDGLIFKSLAHIHPTTQVPTAAVVIFGAFTAIIALLFDIETLVEFLSIGTLMAYTIVSCSVIILRYQPKTVGQVRASESVLTVTTPTEASESKIAPTSKQSATSDDTEALLDEDFAGQLKPKFAVFAPIAGKFEPGSLVSWTVLALVVFAFITALAGMFCPMPSWYGIAICIVFGFLTACCFGIICLHHQSNRELRFKVPLVPLTPVLSVIVNLTLMMHLSSKTWFRLVIWLAVGLLLYFLYGIKHSKENEGKDTAGKQYDTMSSASTPAIENVSFPKGDQVKIERIQPRHLKNQESEDLADAD